MASAIPVSDPTFTAAPTMWNQAKEIAVQIGTLAGRIISPVLQGLAALAERVKEIAVPLFEKAVAFATEHPDYIQIGLVAFVGGIALYKLFCACCCGGSEDVIPTQDQHPTQVAVGNSLVAQIDRAHEVTRTALETNQTQAAANQAQAGSIRDLTAQNGQLINHIIEVNNILLSRQDKEAPQNA